MSPLFRELRTLNSTPPQFTSRNMPSSSSSTGIFFIVCFLAIACLLGYWMWAVNNRKRRERILGLTVQPSHLPPNRSRFSGDPVNRMETGENDDGLPKYTPQARIGEQTVDRSGTAVETNQANNGQRSGWLSTRPPVFRSLTQLPSRPPPAYDPSAPRGS